MKQPNQLLIFSAIIAGAALLVRKRNQQVEGVGNIFRDISNVQRAGIDIDTDYLNLTDVQQNWLQNYARNVAHYRQGKSSRARYSIGEAFFRSLKSIYKKINAVSGVGAFDDPSLLTYTEYPIYDRNGDVAIIFHDNDDSPMLQQLKDTCSAICEEAQNCKDENIAYYQTLFYVAGGGKFVWNGKKKGGTVLYRGLKEEMFPASNGERKAYISILAKREKGGVTIDNLAESWSANNGDFFATKNGIMEALQSISSSGDAKMLLRKAADQMRNDAIRAREDEYYKDVPF